MPTFRSRTRGSRANFDRRRPRAAVGLGPALANPWHRGAPNRLPANGIRALVVGALGTIIEWYDFSLYVFLAPIYARVFFPGEEGLDGVVVTLALFAVAYLARPVGVIVFGDFGDRIGRRGAALPEAPPHPPGLAAVE